MVKLKLTKSASGQKADDQNIDKNDLKKTSSSEVYINTRPTILIGDLVNQNDEANIQK